MNHAWLSCDESQKTWFMHDSMHDSHMNQVHESCRNYIGIMQELSSTNRILQVNDMQVNHRGRCAEVTQVRIVEAPESSAWNRLASRSACRQLLNNEISNQQKHRAYFRYEQMRRTGLEGNSRCSAPYHCTSCSCISITQFSRSRFELIHDATDSTQTRYLKSTVGFMFSSFPNNLVGCNLNNNAWLTCMNHAWIMHESHMNHA